MTSPSKNKVETLDLERFSSWMRDEEAKPLDVKEGLCNIWGVLKFEEQSNAGTFWHLTDELRMTGVRVMVCNNDKFKQQLPKVKPGYTVRIHRVYYNRRIREASIKHPNTVVCWSIYQQVPAPLTCARNPTITEGDEKRRKELEFLFIRNLEQAKDLRSSRILARTTISIAGILVEKEVDLYQHFRLHYHDGTGRFCVRIFKPGKAHDTDQHYKCAETLQVGDFFVVTGSTMHKDFMRVELSCNLNDGRSITKVEDPLCALAITLKEQLKKVDLPTVTPVQQQQPPPPQAQPQDLNNNSSQDSLNQSQENGVPPQKRLRRSPRLNQDPTVSSQSSAYCSQAPDTNLSRQPIEPAKVCEPLPSYTSLQDIEDQMRPATPGYYRFYDIAGQVRGKYNKTPKYDNIVMQFYDGSKHRISSFHRNLVEEPIDGCITILIYNPSGEKPQDTRKHIETAEKLKEGDLIYVKNIKVAIKEGKISFELLSNSSNGKGIFVQELSSEFGKHIEANVNNPDFEEDLIEPEEEFLDAE